MWLCDICNATAITIITNNVTNKHGKIVFISSKVYLNDIYILLYGKDIDLFSIKHTHFLFYKIEECVI